MTAVYDAIVVGARCAGAPTAMLLARGGLRVLLLDRVTFPSDTMSTHFIQRSGVAALGRWGLLERLAATGCPPIAAAGFSLGGMALAASAPSSDSAVSYAPRRTILDKLLAEAALEAGAELREDFVVDGLLVEDGRVSGIRGHARGREAIVERARIVAGADGMHSRIARAVAADEYHAAPAQTCGYYSYFSGIPADLSGLRVFDRRAILNFPTHAGLTCVAVMWPVEEFAEVRGNIEAHFLEALRLAPPLAEAVAAGRREERWTGTAETRNYLRVCHGPGWALAGDAGCHKDPILGTGISDAFRDAELLAEALTTGLSGREPPDRALERYGRQRDEAAIGQYRFIVELARLEPLTRQRIRTLLRLLRGPAAPATPEPSSAPVAPRGTG